MKLTIKKISFNNLILYFIIMLSFASYEYEIYMKAYQLVIFIILALGVFMFLLNITRKEIFYNFLENLRRNLLVNLLSIFLLISNLVSSTKNGLVSMNGLIGVILIILSYNIFYLFMPKVFLESLDDKINKLVLLITFFSVIGIIIAIKGSFLGYGYVDQRVASIFFDPNYFGTLAAIGFIISIDKSNRNKIMAMLNLVALYFSGSRAAMISLLIIMVVFYFYKKKINIKIIVKFLFLGVMIYYFVRFLAEKNFFRIYQGLNLRDNLWLLALDLIKREPLWGYGYGTLAAILRTHGDLHASFHNAYIDYIIMYGIPSFILYSIIIAKSIYLGVKNNVPQYILKCILIFLINANSISINLGGLGAISLLLTLFLGICNVFKIENTYYQNNQIKIIDNVEKR